MQKVTSWWVLALAALLSLASFTATAGPAQQSVRPDGSYDVAAWNDRVCCKRGWQDWWTTRRACQRAGGHPTANRQCRNDWNDQWDFRWWSWGGNDWNQRVCCKRGNRDWWATALECRNAFGYQTANRECRNDVGENRICCKRGWQDWWTTRRACDRAGGYQTANRECRSDWNDQWDTRWWGWDGGNWNNRVCCKKGNRDWWTTALECRNSFGYQTANRECRNDTWNEGWDDRWRPWQGDWNSRVCCKKGFRDWWTTALDCRNSSGYQTANHECRNDNNNGNWNNGGGNWSNDWDDRWRIWQGDWNSRVCCRKGYRDWWASALDCRAAGGYQTMNRECRND